MNELISIVVPVYKVEKFLARCVNSLTQQTYRHLEIILVDDGSPDNCGRLCDELSQKDPRIKVYHKENGGLSDARNYGVSKATGQYVSFIDSDDYVSSNYIEYLYGLLTKHAADISCCLFLKTDADTVAYSCNDRLPLEQVLSGREACKELFGPLYLYLVVAWGKLYKTEIVKKYPFPKGRIHEDEATTGKFFYESQRVVLGNQQLYAYFQNPASIMHSAQRAVNPDAVWALEHRAQFYEQHHEKALSRLAKHMLFRFCVAVSLANGGCFDAYLRNFKSNQSLSPRTKFECRLYLFSKVLFRGYDKICLFAGKIKRKIQRAYRIVCKK